MFDLSTRNSQSTATGIGFMTPSVDGFVFEQDMLTPASTFTLRRVSCCCLDQQLMRNLPDGSGCGLLEEILCHWAFLNEDS